MTRAVDRIMTLPSAPCLRSANRGFIRSAIRSSYALAEGCTYIFTGASASLSTSRSSSTQSARRLSRSNCGWPAPALGSATSTASTGTGPINGRGSPSAGSSASRCSWPPKRRCATACGPATPPSPVGPRSEGEAGDDPQGVMRTWHLVPPPSRPILDQSSALRPCRTRHPGNREGSVGREARAN
jgi:hypothetical protein